RIEIEPSPLELAHGGVLCTRDRDRESRRRSRRSGRVRDPRGALRDRASRRPRRATRSRSRPLLPVYDRHERAADVQATRWSGESVRRGLARVAVVLAIRSRNLGRIALVTHEELQIVDIADRAIVWRFAL